MKLIFIILFIAVGIKCAYTRLPGVYDGGRAENRREKGSVDQCPASTSGSPPECFCDTIYGVGLYNAWAHQCQICKPGTKGTFPNCVCDDNSLKFSAFLAVLDDSVQNNNGCYDPCPEGIVGIHPECECGNNEYYDVSERKCSYVDCPEGTTGTPPKCVCPENYTFYGYFWECFPLVNPPRAAPPPKNGIYCADAEKAEYPQCPVSLGFGVLRSLVG